MGKLSAEDEATLKRLQAAKDAPDDEETVIWVRNGDGHETRLSGARAEAWLKRNGYSESEGDDSSKGDPLDAGGGAPEAGGKKPVKKTAPPVKKAKPPAEGDTIPGEDGEDLDVDDTPRQRRAFF